MSKYFRPWNIDQTLLLPPSVQDFVPKGHVSRFIVELVRESLDLKEITGSYVSGLGQPPFDPRMMVALLLHGYASGLYSSRRIARACRERNDFVMIVALDPPDFRTISDFRKRHLKALGALFLQVLKRACWRPPRRRMPRRMRLSAKTSVATSCRIGPATSRSGWRRSSRRWRRWRLRPSWRRRKSVALRPKKNSSAKPKAARSRANLRHRRRTNPIPSRNATSPIRKAVS